MPGSPRPSPRKIRHRRTVAPPPLRRYVMEDHDLHLLRGYRATDAEAPVGLRARLEEELWEVVIAEEARIRAPRGTTAAGARRRGGWLHGLVRPAIALGAMGALAVGVAVMSDGANAPTSSTAATRPT